jgi:uncharacterized protein YndB with AHSA1/START domain
MKKQPNDFLVARIAMEVSIDAPPERVWQAMVHEINRWWRRDFCTNPATRGFHLEARPGGRMYEDWGDGNGLLWANVLAIEAPRMILLLGNITADFGGPAQTMFQFTVEASEGRSVVKISDTIYGNISDEIGPKTEEGWRMLFEQGLKPYVEGLQSR